MVHGRTIPRVLIVGRALLLLTGCKILVPTKVSIVQDGIITVPVTISGETFRNGSLALVSRGDLNVRVGRSNSRVADYSMQK